MRTYRLLTLIEYAINTDVPESERDQVHALIIEELRRLHEGVLSRYGLRPSQFALWKKHQVQQ